MPCRDYERYIQLYVDQEISEADRRKLLEHTRSCRACRHELKEMVALVSSMEDVRRDIRSRTPLPFRGFFKWVAVCTVAVSFAYLSIPFTQHSFFGKRSEDPTQPLQHSIMVLAGQEESLPIPEDEFVRVVRPSKWNGEEFKSEATLVYPSAISFFVEKQRAWNEYSKRFVFVRVPDKETLITLLTYTGAQVDPLPDFVNTEYPTSIMVTLTDDPQFEIISFPEEKRDIASWFERLSSDSSAIESPWQFALPLIWGSIP